jgi:hypothetical protein
MAIDTAAKRLSALFQRWVRPDLSISASDRAALAGLYSGIPPVSYLVFSGVVGDNTSALNAALATAKAQNKDLFIPSGTYNYSGVLTADGVRMFGVGDSSVLYSTNTSAAAIYLRGDGGGVEHMRLTGITPTVRTSNNESRRIHILAASNFLINNVTIDSGSGAAIMVNDVSYNGTITNNRCSNTLADSIHITDRSHHILVEDNVIRNSGDDGVACVSYAPQGGPVNNVTARRNDIRDNAGGRGMSVIGGDTILYEDNYISNNVHGAGMLFAQEATWDTLSAKNVICRNNRIHNCGKPSIDHTALYISSSTAGPRNENILIQRNIVHFSPGVTNVGGYRASREEINTAFDSNLAHNATPVFRINFPATVLWTEYEEGSCG